MSKFWRLSNTEKFMLFPKSCYDVQCYTMNCSTNLSIKNHQCCAPKRLSVKWVFYPKKKNSKISVYIFWWITILTSKLPSLEAKIKRWKFWGQSQVLIINQILFYFAYSIGYVPVAVDIVWWIFSIHFPFQWLIRSYGLF